MKPVGPPEADPGGGLTEVTQIGDTVRRQAGVWTPAVQALLVYLHSVGFRAAPRPLGRDEQGREVLEFVAGCGPTHSDDELVRVAETIAALHEATRSFTPPPDARWQFMVGAPRIGEVICHNDLSPDNTIYHPTGTPRAFIDWDLAAPSPPIWDLAWAAYRFVPLYDDATCQRLGYPIPSRPHRLRLLCDTYGIDDPQLLLHTVCERIRVLYDTARAWGQAGRPGWRDVWRDTGGQQWLAGLDYVETHSHTWAKLLA
jgi:aminoglycoside phosphotransferase (APT) family kinase protein